jgi:hypothetical protein
MLPRNVNHGLDGNVFVHTKGSDSEGFFLAGLGWKRSWRMAMAKSDIMVPIPMKRCI